MADQIELIIEERVKRELRVYKVAFFAFIAGFVFFITIGLISKGELFRFIIKTVYPPNLIYTDISVELEKDAKLKNSLVENADYDKLTIPNATLQTFPTLSKQLPSTVWSTLSSGEREDYVKMVSNRDFFETILEYHTDLAKIFIHPTSNRARLKAEIQNHGRIPFDVQLLMAGAHLENKPTKHCNQDFHNGSLQAILVIPSSYPAQELGFLDCRFGWPKIKLQVNNFSGIELVGVRRNGKTNRPILLLSREAGRQLKLNGWNSYSANGYGTAQVSEVL
ncbi:hypothetical protein [Alteromonas sp. 009811495]|uniref:hypothetical protein n=1 Tax=Alteromonas sp. 009811495 TaxID=3002962 RepID=UPI00237D3A9A|nr:hypothetical protein [Alteromonas sp. 009811495]WDT85124.1 hypothetical protein OZ660_14425 [Alteromonas sp. 009811495]